MTNILPYSPAPLTPSWYSATAGARPRYPALDGDTACDVAIIGGGYTGLSAAAHLAGAGLDVVLVEARRIGEGASGRNGGQMGTGQRAWAEELEAELGLERARALFDLAEEAKAHLLAFARRNDIAIDHVPGQISAVHRRRLLPHYRAHVRVMAERFGYPHLSFMEREETAERLGTFFYHGAIRDSGTGHIHPLKLAIGTARVAAAAGARLFEETPATGISRKAGRVRIETERGTVTAEKALIAVNAEAQGLEPATAAHVMPIASFIGATVPLGDDSKVLPGGEAVDDSRFVVRYFRRMGDGSLLFGGREVYAAREPQAIKEQIRRQIAEIYPGLRKVELSHAWGCQVGITMPRKPFVREVMPGVISAGGYSGHGVMLANFVGRLYAETVTGNRDRLALFREFKVPPFPGGRRLRAPLLFLALNWYALRDRI